jgi:hypothetical protein
MRFISTTLPPTANGQAVDAVAHVAHEDLQAAAPLDRQCESADAARS